MVDRREDDDIEQRICVSKYRHDAGKQLAQRLLH